MGSRNRASRMLALRWAGLATTLALAALSTAAGSAAQAVTFTRTTVLVQGSGIGIESGLGVGDLDGDGDADLAVALGTGELSIMLRDGATGTYANALGSPHALGADYGGPLRLGDVNGDGRLDVVALRMRDGGSRVAVLLGAGGGAFGAVTAVPVAGEPGALGLADVNGDRALDLVLPAGALPGGARLTVQLGRGDGTFAAATGAGPLLDGAFPSGIALRDVDADGHLDAAVAHIFEDVGVSVLRGDGAGGFARVAGSPFDIGGAMSTLSAGDLDGDGTVDLAAPITPESGDTRTKTVGVLLGDGDGGFRAGPAGSFVTPPALNPATPLALALGDLDGDGDLDATMPITETQTAWMLHGDGTGRFPDGAPSPLSGGSILSAAAIADLDGDGRLDVLATSAAAPSRVFLLINEAEPGIELSAAAADLGSREVGAPGAASATVTISNPGDHGLRVSALSVEGPAAADFAASGCTVRPIPAGEDCDVTVTFAPQAAGARAATLTIASDAPGAPATTVALSGAGTAPPPGPDDRRGGDDGRRGGDDGPRGGDDGPRGGDDGPRGGGPRPGDQGRGGGARPRRATVTVRTRVKLGAALKRGLTLQLSGFRAGRITVTAATGGKRVASARARVARSGSARVTLRFAKAARRRLAAKRSVRLLLKAGPARAVVTLRR